MFPTPAFLVLIALKSCRLTTASPFFTETQGEGFVCGVFHCNINMQPLLAEQIIFFNMNSR